MNSLLLAMAAVVGTACTTEAAPSAETSTHEWNTEAGGPPLAKDVSVVAGSYHTCAILNGGQVKCWGLNSRGQLGVGDTLTRGAAPGDVGANLPAVDLGPGRHAKALALGQDFTCALLDDASVKCWGANSMGELGLGDKRDRGDNPGEMGSDLPALDFGPGRTVKAIHAGVVHTCALLDNAQIRCWGRNGHRQLKNDDWPESVGGTPGALAAAPFVDFGPGRSVKDFDVGTWKGCAILDDDSVRCWGMGSWADGSTATPEPAIAMPPGRSVKALRVGAFDAACVILDDDSLWCWGSGDWGELGLGEDQWHGFRGRLVQRAESPVRMDLGAGGGVQMVFMGSQSNHLCALQASGALKCWGDNQQAQCGWKSTPSHLSDADALGDQPGEMGDALQAVDLGSGLAAKSVAMGYDHTCALLADDRLKCWGGNDSGQLGYGDTTARGAEPASMGDALPFVDLGQ